MSTVPKSTPTTIDVVYDPHGPAWTAGMRGGRPRISLGPTAADTSYHARRLALFLLELVEGISGAEHSRRLNELIEHEQGADDAGTSRGAPVTECHECATDECWYCERGTGTRLAADGSELPVCCCGRVFITEDGARERGDRS